MKNKKADQKAAKQKHLEQLKAQRRKGTTLVRPAPVLTEKPSILIVCEGENTEPSYFNHFRITSARVTSVGEGYNTVSLVNRALALAPEGLYDQVWCVFDKDDFNDNDFNSAIQIAEANNFGVAYSNQSFEYWLILHFIDHQGGGMHRDTYNDKINQHLKPFKVRFDGNGTKLIEEDFSELLDGIDGKSKRKRVDLAVERAKRNYHSFNHANPAKEESSTTVFKLVSELLKYVQ